MGGWIQDLVCRKKVLGVVEVGLVGKWVAGKKVNDIFGFWKTVMGGEKHEVQSWRSRVGQVGSGKGRMNGESMRMGRLGRQKRRCLKTAGVTGIFRFLENRSLTVDAVSGADGVGLKRRLVTEAD